jgi:NitT/TauT family transport system ATP-binding protein
MTELGWYFLAAPLPARKTLFRQAIMKLKLFQIVTEKLAAAPDGRLPAEVVLEDLATLLPYDYPEKLFETLIAWGRYAEILDYDEKSKTITPQESDADEDEETEDARLE